MVTAVKAQMAASVWQIDVAVGERVVEGQTLVVLESMKMEIPVASPTIGVVSNILVNPADSVKAGDVILNIETDGPAV